MALMASHTKKKTIRTIKFRGMLADVGMSLSDQDTRGLGFVYLDKHDIKTTQSGLEVMDRITKENKITDDTEYLLVFMERLIGIGRADLTKRVEEYMNWVGSSLKETPLSKVAVKKTAVLQPINPNVPRVVTEESRDTTKSTINGKYTFKRPDSTTHRDDKMYIHEAKKEAEKSLDEQTKVGTVIVNPTTKEIVGRGHNRKPVGCEDRFQGENELFQPGKRHYVVYSVRDAIFDGYKSKADLKGCKLYTTLYPSSVCAQCIREAGITEVVYCDNKFHNSKFMRFATTIMEGIECRKIEMD